MGCPIPSLKGGITVRYLAIPLQYSRVEPKDDGAASLLGLFGKVVGSDTKEHSERLIRHVEVLVRCPFRNVKAVLRLQSEGLLSFTLRRVDCQGAFQQVNTFIPLVCVQLALLAGEQDHLAGREMF